MIEPPRPVGAAAVRPGVGVERAVGPLGAAVLGQQLLPGIKDKK